MRLMTDTNNGALPAVPTECVRQGVIETFGAICGAAPLYEGDGDEGAACDGIVGIVSLVGDVTWSLMLGIPRETAPALAARFAGFDIPFDSPDMGDAVGELANVLAGDVSARFERAGMTARLSLPTVIRGDNVEMLSSGRLASIRMRFLCDDGPFWLKIVTSQPRRITA